MYMTNIYNKTIKNKRNRQTAIEWTNTDITSNM